MIHLLNVTLSEKKNARLAFKEVFGIGLARGTKLAQFAGLHPNSPLKDVADMGRIEKLVVQNFLVDFELRRKIYVAIKHHKEIRSYKGIRHIAGLPLRGQRTHTNASTQSRLLTKVENRFSAKTKRLKKKK